MLNQGTPTLSDILYSKFYLILSDSCMFYDNLVVYKGFGGVVLAPEEGKHISDALGKSKKNVILQNHG